MPLTPRPSPTPHLVSSLAQAWAPQVPRWVTGCQFLAVVWSRVQKELGVRWDPAGGMVWSEKGEEEIYGELRNGQE